MTTVQETFSKHLGWLIVDVAIILGSLKLLGWLWEILACFWRHTVRPCCQRKGRIFDKYGIKSNMLDSSWAVVTGGSDGIGLGFAKTLAEEGFNICIISRSEGKINEKLEEIRKECRDGDANFKTMCITADFCALRTIDEYRAAIADKLQDLDVGVLIINAGFALGGPFLDLTDKEVEMHIQVNANHVAYTAKVLLSQLAKRFDEKKKKSAVVITSSIMATIPLSGVTCYTATKVFDTYMGEALNAEVKDKIDVISYQPAGVATKMLGESKETKGCLTILPSLAAQTCLRDIGIRKMTRGAFRHEFVCYILESFPTSWLQNAAAKGAHKELESKRADRIKEAERSEQEKAQKIN